MTENKAAFTCIVCPVGCALEATLTADGIAVTGNACPRGEEYAKNELCDPRRVFTTTLPLNGGTAKLLPVRTDLPIRKSAFETAIFATADLTVNAPVQRGDVILRDFTEEGINLISERSSV